MAMSAEHRSKFAALHRQWRRLHMSEKFSLYDNYQVVLRKRTMLLMRSRYHVETHSWWRLRNRGCISWLLLWNSLIIIKISDFILIVLNHLYCFDEFLAYFRIWLWPMVEDSNYNYNIVLIFDFVPFENIWFMWRRNNCRWWTAQFQPLLVTRGL